MVKLEDVDNFNITELRTALKEQGVSGYSGKNKSELQKMLKNALRAKKSKSSPRKKSSSTKGSPRRSPGNNTPENSASNFLVGTVDLGRDGNEYEVAQRSNGVKFWKACTVSTASCDQPPVSSGSKDEYTKEKLEAMSAAAVRSLLDDDTKELARELAKERGATARPTKKDNINAILRLQKRKGKGKEKDEEIEDIKESKRVRFETKVEEIIGEDVDVELKSPDGMVFLNGWTVVGELEPAVNFLLGFVKEDLLKLIEESNKRGLVRFEPDPDCETNCGSEVICLRLEENEYNFESNLRGGYLQEVEVGEVKGKGKVLADFYYKNNLLVGDLDGLYNLISSLETPDISGVLAEPQNKFENVVVVDAKPQGSKRMEILFNFRDKDVFNGFVVRNGSE